MRKTHRKPALPEKFWPVWVGNSVNRDAAALGVVDAAIQDFPLSMGKRATGLMAEKTRLTMRHDY